jgi:tRNA pseudouridine38-40 synthase
LRNIKLTIEYNGTAYKGWQVQTKKACSRAKTIQETIERVLYRMLGERVRVAASGRTDAGVHAKAQVANFKTHSLITPEKLQEGLNGLLPGDIAVVEAKEVDAGFHSRFSAKSKIYRYTILNRLCRSAFLKETAYFCRYPLNVRLMRQEARSLRGTHDFKAFQATSKKEKKSIRTIERIDIIRDHELIHIDIEANGFLYTMARSIVGTLIDAGRGKLQRGALKKILDSKDRKMAGPTAPACGLWLMEVKYD